MRKFKLMFAIEMPRVNDPCAIVPRATDSRLTGISVHAEVARYIFEFMLKVVDFGNVSWSLSDMKKDSYRTSRKHFFISLWKNVFIKAFQNSFLIISDSTYDDTDS